MTTMMKTLRTLSFDDTWNGATHSRGRWTAAEESGSDVRIIATIADDEDRTLVDRAFVREHAVRARDVLALARRVWPNASRVFLSEDVAGWLVVLADEDTWDDARREPSSHTTCGEQGNTCQLSTDCCGALYCRNNICKTE